MVVLGIETSCDETAAAVVDGQGVRADVIHSQEIHARYVIVADGSNSRFGRALGAARDRSYPQGMAIRGYYESPMHDDPWIESALDVRDRNGASMPGYGWIFPVGNGTINEDGDVRPLDVKAGDRILFGKWSGTEVKLDGKDLLIMKESDVMGIIDTKSA
jgi:co-chaperonin GroES (HSP10)